MRVLALFMITSICMHEVAFADSEYNLQIVIEAARQMDWTLPENQAFLLIKNDTTRSVVALIFGYVDNEAACSEIAEALTGQVGSFQCDAIH